MNKNKVLKDGIKDIHWRVEDCQSEDVLFFKIKQNSKWRQWLPKILEIKPKCLIVDSYVSELDSLNQIVVEENQWLETQKEFLDILYPLDEQFTIVAVTGTNGKSSTVHFCQQIVKQNGMTSLSIGTLGVYLGLEKQGDFSLTTPSYIDLRKTFYRYQKLTHLCFVEVSSHALIQQRFYKIKFAYAAWMSFSQDHLDFHGTMESYFNSKMLILNYLGYGGKIILPQSQIDLGVKINQDRVEYANSFESLKLDNKNSILKNHFNQDNFSVAYFLVKKVLRREIVFNTEELDEVPGRYSLRSWRNKKVLIDFAHTPDALENVCLAIKKQFLDLELWVLFGCGGDRDKTKRPLMAKVVEKYATRICITSDNPRTEDPSQIIDDILVGLSEKSRKQVYVEVDRSRALNRMIDELDERSILLVAGKGHEDYLLIGNQKIAYSDYQIVAQAMKDR